MLPSLDWRSPHQPTCSWCRFHSRTHNPLRVTVGETTGTPRQGNRPTGTVTLPQITVAGSHNQITTPEHSYVIALQGPSQTEKDGSQQNKQFSHSVLYLIRHHMFSDFRVFLMRSVKKKAQFDFLPLTLAISKLTRPFCQQCQTCKVNVSNTYTVAHWNRWRF